MTFSTHDSVEKLKQALVRAGRLPEEDEREIGFASNLLVQATMPHSEPEDGSTTFERYNGCIAVRIIANPKYGVPFGTYPRLILAHITTEAVRNKSPNVDLGKSLSEFLRYVGLAKSGGEQGSAQRLKQHMQRLFTATISAERQRAGKWEYIHCGPIDHATIFWNPRKPEQVSLWTSTVVLSKYFYDEVVCNPVPIDLDALRQLARTRSPLAMDIYQWLTYRFSRLSEPTVIPWESLALQFGGEYSRLRAFAEAFRYHLEAVREVYPGARAEPTDEGLRLSPSPPHVSKRSRRSV